MTHRRSNSQAPNGWPRSRRMIQHYMDKAGPDVKLSICEVFTGVPKHLDKHGNGVICRGTAGSPTASCTSRTARFRTPISNRSCDYTFIVPFARMKIEPSTMADYEKLAGRRRTNRAS